MKRAALVVVALLGGTARADDQGDLDAQFAALTAKPKPRYLRPFLEEAAVIAAGTAWYWLDEERQQGDWDYPSWRQRFNGEAWRFDNNPFPINFAWHPIDAGQYHLFARTSDLSLPVAMGYGLATSFVWEWGLEFREKTSVNDMIVTTGAGTPLGEFFHWLGRYLESAPDPRWWHTPARWVLTTTRAAHNVLDDRDGLRPGTAPDALGLSDDIWHRFVMSAGATTQGWATVAAQGELAALPGYLQPREMHRAFRDGNVSAVDVRVSLGDDAIGFEFGADVMLLGVHHQDARRATTIGLDLAYRYRKEHLGDYDARVAQMHLPGLAVDQRVGPLRMKARANVDFAGLDAGAYAAWAARHNGELVVEKTILRKHGYYYGWGPSASLSAELVQPRFTVGASISFARYDSQEGLDRSQEDVTDDVDAGDRLLRWESWARATPFGRGFVEARVTGERDDGHVGEVESRRSLTRVTLSIGATL